MPVRADHSPASPAPSDSAVPARHTEGLLHAFLVLKNREGEVIADGELQQSVIHAGRVKSQLVFHFKDGSLQDETTIFSQNRYLRLLSNHLIQKGPSFKYPLNVVIDGTTGQIAGQYTDEDGNQKTINQHIAVPANLANGLYITFIKSLGPKADSLMLSMLAMTPKPRMVKLKITAEGEDTFSVGDVSPKATRYIMKFDLGGVIGAVAPIVGKQPPDTQIWIIGGEAPTFVKSEGQFYVNGPIWRVELVSPIGPKREDQGHESRR